MADNDTVNMLAISSTGSGDGNPVRIQTPQGQANVAITYITPLLAILIRSLKAFGVTMLGILSAQMVNPTLIAAPDFYILLKKAASFSVAAACMGALTSSISLLSKLEEKFPSLGA